MVENITYIGCLCFGILLGAAFVCLYTHRRYLGYICHEIKRGYRETRYVEIARTVPDDGICGDEGEKR